MRTSSSLLLYTIRMTLKEPLIIGSKFSKGWYAIRDPSIINGRLLWGAILSIAAEQNPKIAAGQHYKPSIAISSAFPLDKGKKCLPLHPFSTLCKITEINENESREDKKPVVEAVKASNLCGLIHSLTDVVLKEWLEYLFSKECLRIGDIGISRGLRMNAGGLMVKIYNVNKELVQFIRCGSVKTVSVEMVAIDKEARSARQGMLYTFEAIKAGTQYHALIAGSPGDLKELFESLGMSLNGGRLKARIGRGTSRGYGLVELEFKAHDTLLNEIINNYDEGCPVFYALAPIFYDKTLLQIKGISVDRVFSSGKLIVRGWSRLYNKPTRIIDALYPGAVLVMKNINRIGYGELLMMLQEVGGPGMNFIVPVKVFEKMFT